METPIFNKTWAIQHTLFRPRVYNTGYTQRPRKSHHSRPRNANTQSCQGLSKFLELSKTYNTHGLKSLSILALLKSCSIMDFHLLWLTDVCSCSSLPSNTKMQNCQASTGRTFPSQTQFFYIQRANNGP